MPCFSIVAFNGPRNRLMFACVAYGMAACSWGAVSIALFYHCDTMVSLATNEQEKADMGKYSPGRVIERIFHKCPKCGSGVIQEFLLYAATRCVCICRHQWFEDYPG